MKANQLSPQMGKKAQTSAWRNRIVGHGEEDPSKLLAHPKNWRVHPENQKAALTGLLAEVGWVQDVIVNQRTGFLIDGHARVQLAAGEKVPVVYVDLSEEEEAKVLASLDTVSQMALADDAALNALVDGVDFGSDALDAFVASMLESTGKTMIKNASSEGNKYSAINRSGRNPGISCKTVLFVEDAKTVEMALRATGERNRGAALVKISEAFLKSAEAETFWESGGKG